MWSEIFWFLVMLVIAMNLVGFIGVVVTKVTHLLFDKDKSVKEGKSPGVKSGKMDI